MRLRFLRLARSLRLVRIVGTANRGLNALGKSFSRRGLGYVLVTTGLVTVLGAAGMLAFEPERQVAGGFTGYGDALWWTAMLITTMGSGFWPETAEGRVLALLLSLYAFGVFGYITASFATFFIGQEANARTATSPARANWPHCARRSHCCAPTCSAAAGNHAHGELCGSPSMSST
jgi:voltage-gated potassium channel